MKTQGKQSANPKDLEAGGRQVHRPQCRGHERDICTECTGRMVVGEEMIKLEESTDGRDNGSV